MRGLLKFLVVLFMPLVLIAGGAGAIGLGLDREWSLAIWTGLVLIGVGILWGLFLFLLADSGSIFD